MRLFAQVMGTGQPVLIIHGLFGMSDNWVTIGKRLAQSGFAAHLVDLRNHGRSPHVETHTYQDMGDDLLNHLDQEKLDKVSVIGHSMGGKVAMHLALRHPQKIKDLVVVDIAPYGYCCHQGSLHSMIIDHLMEIDLSSYKNQSAITAQIEERLNNRPLSLFLAKNIKRSSDRNYAWKLNLPVLKQYLPDIYSGMENLESYAPAAVRTVFVKGNNSDYIGPQHQPYIQRYFPNSNVVGVENAGHWLHAEQPDKFIEIVVAFLKPQ